jgi:hypothetical protein
MDIERITPEQAQAMDSFQIHNALMQVVPLNNEIREELQNVLNLLAAAQTKELFPENFSKDEARAIKAEIIELERRQKLVNLRMKILHSNKNVLQSTRKGHE